MKSISKEAAMKMSHLSVQFLKRTAVSSLWHGTRLVIYLRLKSVDCIL